MDKDLISVFVICGLGGILLSCLVGYTRCFIECNAKAKVLGYTCDYGIFTGCVLHKPDGTNILLEQIRDYR